MLSIAVVEPEYEINLGYIARVMKNFELDNLLLINPKCNIEKAKIYATHGADILEKAKLVDMDYLKNFNQLIGTTSIRATSANNIIRNSVSPEEVRLTDNSCILLGRESIGLTNEELAMCDIIITIECGKYNTMNISHALAIILYELTKNRFNKVNNAATREEIELLLNYVSLLSSKVGVSDHKKAKINYAFKRILGRATVTSKEVRLLIVLLRKCILAIDKRFNC